MTGYNPTVSTSALTSVPAPTPSTSFDPGMSGNIQAVTELMSSIAASQIVVVTEVATATVPDMLAITETSSHSLDISLLTGKWVDEVDTSLSEPTAMARLFGVDLARTRFASYNAIFSSEAWAVDGFSWSHQSNPQVPGSVGHPFQGIDGFTISRLPELFGATSVVGTLAGAMASAVQVTSPDRTLRWTVAFNSWIAGLTDALGISGLVRSPPDNPQVLMPGTIEIDPDGGRLRVDIDTSRYWRAFVNKWFDDTPDVTARLDTHYTLTVERSDQPPDVQPPCTNPVHDPNGFNTVYCPA